MHEAVVVNGVFEHLKSLHYVRKFIDLHAMLHNLFGEYVENYQFMTFVAKKLGVKHVKRFFESAQHWKEKDFKYGIPSSCLLRESKQKINDIWLQNSCKHSKTKHCQNVKSTVSLEVWKFRQ